MKLFRLIASHKIVSSALAIGVIGSSAAGISIHNTSQPLPALKSATPTQSTKADVSKTDITNPVSAKPVDQTAPVATVTPQPVETAPTPVFATDSTYKPNTQEWYMYKRRIAAGKTVGVWADISNWSSNAQKDGLLVDRNIQQYDVCIFNPSGNTYIPIFVESVDQTNYEYSRMINSTLIKRLADTLDSISNAQYLCIH